MCQTMLVNCILCNKVILILMQVDSVYRSTFFNFIVYMIYQINKNCSLDILLRDNWKNCMFNLFLKLLDAYSIPKLAEIKVILYTCSKQVLLYCVVLKQAFNNTWDCRVHTTSRNGYMPQFPFFMKVSAQICNIVKRSMAEINKNFNILQEKDSSLSIGSCGKINYLVIYFLSSFLLFFHDAIIRCRQYAINK